MTPDNDTHPASIEYLVLRDGRAIEIVHLGEGREAPGAPSSARDAEIACAAADLAHCAACGSTLVQPVEWEEEGPRHWRLELRCPNCEARGTVVVEDAVVDRYDLALEQAAAALARQLHDIVQLGIEDEVRSLSVALETGLLVPEDF
ncbi:unannotated protein [freshwater metagenome]|uniref:Unannotated protein n=1 Tax=freshwater metagenome TaxID=449393 RepID=A0A6J7H715_9ZZZZ|nr:hypothetical protein [Actinomycetota bacterium]